MIITCENVPLPRQYLLVQNSTMETLEICFKFVQSQQQRQQSDVLDVILVFPL